MAFHLRWLEGEVVGKLLDMAPGGDPCECNGNLSLVEKLNKNAK